MTTLAELKTKADNLGLDRGIVRLYGDLRKIETWEKAVTAYNTVTVEAEVSDDEISQVVDEIYSDLRQAQKHDEIIPFIPEVDLAECNDRKSTMLFEVQRQRAIFEKKQAIADCPPPPPPAPIVRPCPIPERLDIPGVEIAERESPSPGDGRDGRFRNLGDRLFEQIKSDILRYFEHYKQDIEYCWKNDYFDDSQNQELNSLIDLMVWNIKNKSTIFDVWATVPFFKREGFYKLIPFSIQHFFTNGIPPVNYWECTRETNFLLIYTYAPIPSLLPSHADKYGGILMPQKHDELEKRNHLYYLWKFPGAIQCENFLHEIIDAKEYAIIPANKPITTSELVLVGV